MLLAQFGPEFAVRGVADKTGRDLAKAVGEFKKYLASRGFTEGNGAKKIMTLLRGNLLSLGRNSVDYGEKGNPDSPRIFARPGSKDLVSTSGAIIRKMLTRPLDTLLNRRRNSKIIASEKGRSFVGSVDKTHGFIYGGDANINRWIKNLDYVHSTIFK